jgi:hypothetical protein
MKITIFEKEINIIWVVITFISILCVIFAFVVSLSPSNQIDPIIGLWKYETSENVTVLTFDGIQNFECNYYSKIVYDDSLNFHGSWRKESNNKYIITFDIPTSGAATGTGTSTIVYNSDNDSIYRVGLPDQLLKRVRR